jgi:hypothetical protein
MELRPVELEGIAEEEADHARAGVHQHATLSEWRL